jgi:hypothetical protein
MARNGSGQFDLLVNSWNPAINGTLATAGDYQALINDIAAALTQSVSRDGQTPMTGNLDLANNKITGVTAGAGTGEALAFQQLFNQGVMADLASATTTDIGAQNTNFLRVTGTTTITSFGTNFKGPRFLVFAGAVTLTNSATLVLPGGANITTAAGDVLIAIPGATLGAADKWIVTAYQKNAVPGAPAAGTVTNDSLAVGAVYGSKMTSKIEPVTGSVASSALTVTLNPTVLDFRSATIGSGTVNTRTISTAISAVVPSGATLGTTNAVLSKVTLIALDNAGTVELAVCNGSLSLDESTLISTTVLDAASDSATVIYSATARTNVPFRIVGYVESTQATAGTWATAPSKIQGIGGQIRQATATSGGGITSGTAVASTSGTAIDFTGIPSGVKRITVMFAGVSTNGSSIIQVQLGDAGGVENTGYAGLGGYIQNSAASAVAGIASGFAITAASSAASVYVGSVVLTLLGNNQWIANGSFARTDSVVQNFVQGSKTLSDTLDRVRITTVNGTDTFDAGTINILYE